MSALGSLLRKVIPSRDSHDIDSEVTSSFIPLSDCDREVNIEQNIEAVARDQLGFLVKVAVFKRIRLDRGHVLAVVRMQNADLDAPKDPEQFISQLVHAFNYRAEHTFQKQIDYAIWTDLASRPTQVRSQLEVAHRAA